MASVSIQNAAPEHLDSVQLLWRKSSDSLGFMPLGAFEERLARRQILVAICEGDVVGYLLYFTTATRRVRVTHLCIAAEHRGKGIAKRLITALRHRTKQFLGIGLHCRRDLAAWDLWLHLGFVAVSEKPGKGADGGVLTYFWLPFGSPSLFGPDIEPEAAVVIDANVFFDLEDISRDGAEESHGLLSDWLQADICLCLTDELRNEVMRNPDASERDRRYQSLQRFPTVECSPNDFEKFETQVRALLGEPDNHRDAADQRQIARTLGSGASLFVTRDEPLLSRATELYKTFGLTVVRPSQLIGRFDELRNRNEYQRDRLVGSAMMVERISGAAADSLEPFREQSSEMKGQWTKRFGRYFADPVRYACHVVKDELGEPSAAFVFEQSDAALQVPLLRVSTTYLKRRLGETLARTLVAQTINRAIGFGLPISVVTDTKLQPQVKIALHAAGFVERGDRLVRYAERRIHDAQLFVARLEELKKLVPFADEYNDMLISMLVQLETEANCIAAAEAEHLLWPGKITGCGIPCFAVPIRPNWAMELFDSKLAGNTFWGASSELALNPVSVYYRAARPSVLRFPGRILWYTSRGRKRVLGGMAATGCSRIEDVMIGPAKQLFQKYERFGVYKWPQVLRTAKQDPNREIMAIRFADTELFQHRIGQKQLRRILRDHGVTSNLPSPVEIPEAAFEAVYRAGFGL